MQFLMSIFGSILSFHFSAGQKCKFQPMVLFKMLFNCEPKGHENTACSEFIFL